MTIDVPHYGVVPEEGAVWLETCFHEAGHAVAARELGVEVLEVVATGEGSGYTRCADDDTDLERMTRAQVRNAQVIDAAGGVASEIALVMFAHQSRGEASRWRAHPSCGGDRALFIEQSAMPGAVSMATAWNAAHRLLSTHWGAVEGLAYSLSETGRLAGAEVNRS